MDTNLNTNLNQDDVVSTLNDLIETCKDGEYGFRACSEKASSSGLAMILSRRAEDCRKAASELQQHVVELGGEPDESGSVRGALHRGWVAMRNALSSYDDLALLEECERGEDIAVASYRKALEKPMPDAVRMLVERQYQGAKLNHDQIRGLRNAAKQ